MPYDKMQHTENHNTALIRFNINYNWAKNTARGKKKVCKCFCIKYPKALEILG